MSSLDVQSSRSQVTIKNHSGTTKFCLKIPKRLRSMRNLKQNKAGNTKHAPLQYLQERMEPKRNYNFVLLPTARSRIKTNYIYLYVYLPDPEVPTIWTTRTCRAPCAHSSRGLVTRRGNNGMRKTSVIAKFLLRGLLDYGFLCLRCCIHESQRQPSGRSHAK